MSEPLTGPQMDERVDAPGLSEGPTQALPSRPDAGTLYDDHVGFLTRVAVGKFHVPVEDAGALAHDVFAGYLAHPETVRRPHDWLVGGIANASRYYWRVADRTEALPADFAEWADPSAADFGDAVIDRLALDDAIAQLHPTYQATVRLRFWEGLEAKEVAATLGVTEQYAEKLFKTCIHKVRAAYFARTGRVR